MSATGANWADLQSTLDARRSLKPLMQMLENDEFLRRVSVQAIGLDTRYEPPQTLGFANGHRLRIELPERVHETHSLIGRLVSVVSGGTVYVWKRGGLWNADRP